jgi:hypothetical protein
LHGLDLRGPLRLSGLFHFTSDGRLSTAASLSLAL